MRKELFSALGLALAIAMLCTSCGKRTIDAPEEQPYMETQQDVASSENSTIAVTEPVEAKAEEPEVSDEEFYAEILDMHYYDLASQREYEDFYYPGSMVTYVYSKDGYDKAGALDYSGYGFEDLDEFTSSDLGTIHVVGVESTRGDDDNTVWKKVDVSGAEFSITAKEAEEAMAEYRDRRITPVLTAFSQYTPSQPQEYYDGADYSTFGAGYDSWNDG